MAMFIVKSFNESPKTPCKLLPTWGIINFKRRIPLHLVVNVAHRIYVYISHLITKKFTSHHRHLEGGLRSTLTEESSFIPIIGKFDHVLWSVHLRSKLLNHSWFAKWKL
jgi:hypothetical protein